MNKWWMSWAGHITHGGSYRTLESLCLIKHHAMKACGEWKRVVSLKLRPLYLPGNESLIVTGNDPVSAWTLLSLFVHAVDGADGHSGGIPCDRPLRCVVTPDNSFHLTLILSASPPDYTSPLSVCTQIIRFSTSLFSFIMFFVLFSRSLSFQ
jgi:hypothetical protein